MLPVFNIRVYGLLINENNNVLVSDEYVFGRNITKFPGGGLQFGEGTIDCLKREFREEMDADITVKSHFYTTDFFQPSFLNNNHQVISIYYIVEMASMHNLQTTNQPFDFKEIKDGAQSFRWLNIKEAIKENITFPIDRKVLSLLKNHL